MVNNHRQKRATELDSEVVYNFKKYKIPRQRPGN